MNPIQYQTVPGTPDQAYGINRTKKMDVVGIFAMIFVL
jgi:hypothetical protein